MRIISIRALRDFWDEHPDSEQPLKAWFSEAKRADWANFHAVFESFPRASAVGSNRIVFRIKGNDFRLIVRVSFAHRRIWIKFVGTHAEYDKIDASTIDNY